MRKFLLIILFPVLTLAGSPDSLVGVWQDSDVLASGWSNSFLFFSDGTYGFYLNQMDCSKRLVAYYGKWKMNEDIMTITVEKRVIITGGEMKKSDGSCGSDSMIAGGTLQTVNVIPQEEFEYPVSKIYVENSSGIERKYAYIDAMKYWYFGDPAELRPQFEGK